MRALCGVLAAARRPSRIVAAAATAAPGWRPSAAPPALRSGFDGAAYCHKCGAARVRARKDDAGARCPACRSELQRIDVGSTPLLECASCDGVWVDADVFERLCAQRESQAAVLQRLSTRTTEKTTAAVKYRPCLRCGTMMNRVNFGKLSGAVIDVCRGHGTFLDAGELHQIVAFIQGGGLDRARARSIEDLKEEERRLKDLQRKAMLDRRASGEIALDGRRGPRTAATFARSDRSDYRRVGKRIQRTERSLRG